MSRTLRRVLTVVIGLVLVLAISAGALAYTFTKTLPPRSFPQVSGDIQLNGLDGPVDIYRDTLGIPQIYASSRHDVFFAQGYVHAQDRFWQMDFWRHIGSARLSEMFGKGQLDTDIFLRRLGWARVARQELETMDADSKAVLEAYAEGVNAYLADHQGEALSLEYAVLKLTNPGYKIEPWEPLHSLTWAKAMAWDLRGNMDEEGDRAVLLKTLSPEQVNELYPAYPEDHPLILPGYQATGLPAEQADAPAPAVDEETLAVMQKGLREQSDALDELLGPGGVGFGSNNWVISGKLTASGMPLLANDPHLGPQMPSIWYQIGLHCAQKSADCPLELAGFSFAGAPGVVIGHNDRIAWGFTNTGPDVMDVYIEKINPENPDEYEFQGQWETMRKVEETIQIAGGASETITVRYTRHGPILWEDAEAIDKFREESGLDLPQEYRLALRWTALDPSNTFPALWRIDTAQNWDEFRAGAQLFDVPAQNFVYADVDGNIGYQMPGKIPVRAKGDGRTYVPGWTGEYEWTGMIPFEELPHAFNPPEGYIATANNRVVGADYPYLISTDWDYGYRAARIVDMIKNAPGPIDSAYIQQMQGDDRNLSLEFTLPLLQGIHWGNPQDAIALDLLTHWDGEERMDSPEAALYEAFWRNLLVMTFADDLPEDQQPEGGSRWFEVVRNLSAQAESSWWDNQKTPQKETRDDIFPAAFSAAVKEMRGRFGSDPASWNWGNLHTITFRNKTLGESGIAPIEALFNRGPFRTAGGESIVNATGWDISDPYQVSWLPSMRMIVDLGNLDASLAIHTTGQSGHAYHENYDDMVDLWRNIDYLPMAWDAATIQARAKNHLRLLP